MSHLCAYRSHSTEVPKEGGLSPLTLHPHVVARLRTNGITFESPVIINPKREREESSKAKLLPGRLDQTLHVTDGVRGR